MTTTTRSVPGDLRGIPGDNSFPYEEVSPIGDLSPAPWSAHRELTSATSLDGALLHRHREASKKFLELRTRIQHAVTGRLLPEKIGNVRDAKVNDLEDRLQKLLKERDADVTGNPPGGFLRLFRQQSMPSAKDQDAEAFLEERLSRKIEDIKTTVTEAESLAAELCDRISSLEKFLDERAEFADAAVKSIDQLSLALDQVAKLGEVPEGLYNLNAMSEVVDKNLNAQEVRAHIAELAEAKYRLAYLTYIFPWFREASDVAPKGEASSKQ